MEELLRGEVIKFQGSVDKDRNDIKEISLILTKNGHPLEKIPINEKNETFTGFYVIPKNAEIGEYKAIWTINFGDSTLNPEDSFTVKRDSSFNSSISKSEIPQDITTENKIHSEIPIDIQNSLMEKEKQKD